ncbi:bifunctional diguanylate cyclase/phosphodiesterase [Actinomycetes bacterium KLBMP 9759]
MTAPPSPGARRSGAASMLGAAIAVLVLGGLVTALEGDVRRLVANVGVMLLAAGGGLGCWRAAVRTVGRTRLGWVAMAFACWSWAAGQAAWTVYEDVLGIISPYPSLADAGYFGFAVLAIVGLVFITPPESGLATPRRVLDALIVGIAIGLLAWMTALESIIENTGGTFLRAAFSIAYPVADIAMLTISMLTIAQTRTAPLRWLVLGAGVLAMAVSDTAFAYMVAEGSYVTGSVIEWGWRSAFGLLGAAGMLVTRADLVADVAPKQRSATPVSVLPYIPLTAAIIGAAAKSATGAIGIVDVVMLLLLVLLVLLRQYLTVRENLQLTRTVQQREVQLHRLAFHDALTGLANRALFLDRLGHALELASRTPQQVSVAFIDLDGFKAVNDTLGHASGDTLLALVADRLRDALRASDTLARLGGDEFAVLLEQGGDPSTVAHRLLEALEEPFHVEGRTVTISASIGVATQEPDMADAPVLAGPAKAAALLHRADVAMYAVKTSGKGDVGAHSAAAESNGLRPHGRHHRPVLDGAFAAALDRGEVYPIYQPVVEPTTGRIAALEALARWTHDGETVPPSTFIPICEAAGLSQQLTALMVEKACAQLATWNRRLGHQRLRVAVNINPQELSDTGLPDRIASAIARYGLASGQLALEMTENSVGNRPDTTIDVMTRLRVCGVRLALDDFGTGYSTLARLARTPVDTVKIDQFFVAHIDHDERQRRFLRGMLDLTRHLGLRTVAEGVERPGQLRELRRQGCDLVQGNLVGKPQPASKITPLVLAETPVVQAHILGLPDTTFPALRTGQLTRPGFAP